MAQKRNVFIRIPFIAIAIVLTLPIGVTQAMAQETANSVLATLHSTSRGELERFVEHYRQQRQADVQALISILSEEEKTLKTHQRIKTQSMEWFAITLLGDLRSGAAAPLLVELLAVRDSSFSLIHNEDNPDWYAFPAAVALSKIGVPAVEHLLELARRTSPTDTAFQLSAVTLEAILNPELAITAVEQYARHYPDLSEENRLAPLTALIQSGHKRWSAGSAADFSPD